MALIKCSECGKEISSMAQSCPNCGRPLIVNKSSDSHDNQSEKKQNSSSVEGVKRKVPILIYIPLIASILVWVILAGDESREAEHSYGALSYAYCATARVSPASYDECKTLADLGPAGYANQVFFKKLGEYLWVIAIGTVISIALRLFYRLKGSPNIRF